MTNEQLIDTTSAEVKVQQARDAGKSLAIRYAAAANERDQLAAQVERLRIGHQQHVDSIKFTGDAHYAYWVPAVERSRELLAETPEQSLAAVREQARRKALEEAADQASYEETMFGSTGDNPQETRHWERVRKWLRDLAAQPAKEPQP